LAPNDFWLFPKIRSTSKGRRFQDIEDVNLNNVTTTLNVIRMQEFQKCFQQLQYIRAKYTDDEGEYFEGDPFH